MEKFYMEPTLEFLNLLKKKELIDAAKHFDLKVNESVSKAELRKLVLGYLVEEELMSGLWTWVYKQTEGEKLLEIKRLKFQEWEHKRENQVKLKELELKKETGNPIKDPRIRISFTRGPGYDICEVTGFWC